MTTPSPEKSIFPLIPFESRLPIALQYAIERRYYEDFIADPKDLVEPDAYDVQAHTRFFPLLEIAHGADVERSLHQLNMQNVLSSLRDSSHSLAFLASSDGERVRLYIGICRLNPTAAVMPTDEYVQMLRQALRSNFPGIDCGTILNGEKFREQVYRPMSSHDLITAFTGVPTPKNLVGEHFAQGLERLFEGLHGERYCFLVIAEPIARAAIDQIVDNCRSLSTAIHAQVKQYVTAGRGSSTTESIGQTESFSTGMGSGILSVLMNFFASYTTSKSTSNALSQTENLSVGREALDKAALYSEQMLDYYVTRLQRGKGLGLWNVGMFLLADHKNTLLRGQGIIRGLFTGTQSHVEPLRALDLNSVHAEIQGALLLFRNPTLSFRSGSAHPLGEAFHKLATPLATDELAVVMNLPRREVPGIKLHQIVDFGLNPPRLDDGIDLGRIIYHGQELDEPLSVDMDSLTKHTFITGVTGAGKTNTCLTLLRSAYEQRRTPFLVIEPAKTEYRVLLADSLLGVNLQVFTLGDEQTAPFRLNPFAFIRGFNLLTHIDLLKAVFNASFPMYASMPYILEEALLEVYTERGWDIASSSNRFVDVATADFTPYLPTLEDVYNQIDSVVERKRYAERLTMDISAALKARLQSLLIGGKGLMLNTQQSIPIEQILDRPTVLELRYIGDDDEKAFLMAILLVLIYEYCQVNRPSDKLQHLTLVEEAHRLLKNIPPAIAAETANARGKAVELFTDILAEIREYGEGFIIIDQIPSKLAPDVVKNTNLKILHRLVAQDDRHAVGNAMGLNSEQLDQVVHLEKGEAIIHNADLDTPVLTKILSLKDDLKDLFMKTIGHQGLKDHMDSLRLVQADHFRRWLGCHVCDAPCTYLSLWNHPDEQARRIFQQFLNVLLYSSVQVCYEQWGITEATLGEALACRYPSGEVPEGVLICHLVQLTRLAVADWQKYYGISVDQHITYMAFQQQLMDTIYALHNRADPDQIAATISVLRINLWENLSHEPRRRQFGCAMCQMPCRFGYLVQVQQPPQKGALSARIKEGNTDPEFGDNFQRLVRLVNQYALDLTGISVTSEMLSHLGYCYLANVTDKQHILAGYQKAIIKS